MGMKLSRGEQQSSFIHNHSMDYRDRLIIEMLPLMMEYEIMDIMFLINLLKSPSSHFNIADYAWTQYLLQEEGGSPYLCVFQCNTLLADVHAYGVKNDYNFMAHGEKRCVMGGNKFTRVSVFRR